MRTKLVFLILLSALFLNGFSQNNNRRTTITGNVLDAEGRPVTNAMVVVDGSGTRSVTDEDGRFLVRVRRDANLLGIVTPANGMTGQLIEGRNRIDFKLTTNVATELPMRPGEEGINTGYNVVKKKHLTTQVDRIDGTNKKYASYSSIFEMIQRESSGVRISNGAVIIHDSKNLSGSVPALLVVDGVYVNSIGNIPPSMVESINVLKGTSAAIYGSRGYGGAVVITTKTNN